MSVTYSDECVGCPKEIGCLGSVCPNRNVAHLECDKCHEEVEDLYKTEDGQLCEICVLKMFEKVKIL